jgi:DNA repair exonuclease SbcCD nuclease subunit
MMTNLFKKAAFFTDIHFGLKVNSLQHNTDCANFIDWFISVAKKEKCETCFFLGDWHHKRAAINIQTLQFGLHALEKLSAAFDHVYFIPGNHDQFYKDKRDIHAVEWAKHLPNITIINDWFTHGDVTIAPWLVGDDWTKLKNMSGKYMFGHFELPHFYMNAMMQMPDHNEIQINHLKGFDEVFSGHFHKRQSRGNVTYIGNAFPHNYTDVGDDLRGMMIKTWDGKNVYHAWPNAPKFRAYALSDVIDKPKELLLSGSYIRVNIDVDISFEEARFIKEQFMTDYKLKEFKLIPVKTDFSVSTEDNTPSEFESVDSIIQTQIGLLEDGAFDKKLLLEIYDNL